MSRRFGSKWLLGLLVIGCVQCGEKKEERPAAFDCGSDCSGLEPPVGGSSLPSGGGSESEQTTVQGQIVALDTENFDLARVTTYGQDARVVFQRSDGSLTEVEAQGGQFVAEAVIRSSAAFFAISPAASGDLMDTIQWVNTDTTSAPLVYLMRPSILDQVFALVEQPVERDEDTAQVILRFNDPDTGEPLSGVEVTAPEGASVIYDAAGTWSVATEATGGAGSAILANVPVGSSELVLVELELGGTLTSPSGGFSVYVQAGAASFFRYQPTSSP